MDVACSLTDPTMSELNSTSLAIQAISRISSSRLGIAVQIRLGDV